WVLTSVACWLRSTPRLARALTALCPRTSAASPARASPRNSTLRCSRTASRASAPWTPTSACGTRRTRFPRASTALMPPGADVRLGGPYERASPPAGLHGRHPDLAHHGSAAGVPVHHPYRARADAWRLLLRAHAGQRPLVGLRGRHGVGSPGERLPIHHLPHDRHDTPRVLRCRDRRHYRGGCPAVCSHPVRYRGAAV